MKKHNYTEKEIEESFRYFAEGKFIKMVCPIRVLKNYDAERFRMINHANWLKEYYARPDVKKRIKEYMKKYNAEFYGSKKGKEYHKKYNKRKKLTGFAKDKEGNLKGNKD